MVPAALFDYYSEGIDFSLPLEDQLPPEHPEPLFVLNGVATYVSRGRAYRGPAPVSPPLPPLGHGAGGVLPAQVPAPQVGRGRAAGVAELLRIMRNPGRSRN